MRTRDATRDRSGRHRHSQPMPPPHRPIRAPKRARESWPAEGVPAALPEGGCPGPVGLRNRRKGHTECVSLSLPRVAKVPPRLQRNAPASGLCALARAARTGLRRSRLKGASDGKKHRGHGRIRNRRTPGPLGSSRSGCQRLSGKVEDARVGADEAHRSRLASFPDFRASLGIENQCLVTDFRRQVEAIEPHARARFELRLRQSQAERLAVAFVNVVQAQLHVEFDDRAG